MAKLVLNRRSVLIGAAATALPTWSWAADFPTRAIDLVIPFPPGGGADVYGRVIAKGLETVLRQPVVPINKPGASTLIGTNWVKNAKPDGYTLLFAASAFLINSVVRKVDYDPTRDFEALGMVTRATYVLVSNPKRGFSSVADLISFAKANPNALKFGSPGIGVSGQLAGDLLRNLAGISFADIRYKGASEAVLATMSGEVDFCFESPVTILSNVKAGRLKVLAAASEVRDPLYPDIPTIAETLPGYAIWPWFGLVGPRGLPQDILSVLRGAVEATSRDPETKKRLSEMELEPFYMPADKMVTFMEGDKVRWTKIASKEDR